MIGNILFLLCLCVASIHFLAHRKRFSRLHVVDLYLAYFLFFTVGLVALTGFIGHVFFADQVAAMIGWPAGNPFQFEVGFSDGAFALLGILSYWFRDKFWLATGLGWSFFLLGAAYGHIVQASQHGNYAPYNLGSILPDIAIPVALLILLYLKFIHLRHMKH